MQIHPSRIGIVLAKFLLVGAEFYLQVENLLVGRELFTGGEYVRWSNIFFFTARQENTLVKFVTWYKEGKSSEHFGRPGLYDTICHYWNLKWQKHTKIWRIFLSSQETLQDGVTRIARTDCKNPRLVEYLHEHAISLVPWGVEGPASKFPLNIFGDWDQNFWWTL